MFEKDLDALNAVFDAANRKAIDKLGKINILVAGLAGVGKSTLINAVFGQSVAITGTGFSQTQKIEAHENPNSPLRIYDTRGFEIANSQATVGAVRDCIQRLRGSTDANDQIHITWTCVLEQSHRIEPVHQNLLSLIRSLSVPSIVVITQAFGEAEMEQKVRELAVPNDGVIPVLAEPKTLAGHTLPVRGVDELVQRSMHLVPQAHRAAFIAAQTACWDLKEVEIAKIINRNSMLAAGSALIPVPGGHSVALIGLQAALIAEINAILGISLKDEGSKEVAKGLFGILFAKMGGTLVFTEAMKAVPVVGWFGAALIGGPIGGAATKAFGHLYYKTVSEYARRNLPLPPPEILAHDMERTYEARKGYFEALAREPV